VRRFFEAVAANQPTVLVFEDVHWAGAELLDLLEEMAGRARSLPLLMVAVARPELLDNRPGWGGGLSAYTALPLDALSAPEVRELAGLLVEADADDQSMTDTIERAAGGNPLFVEELVAWIAEGRHGADQVPATVRAVIAARLDLLPPAERAVTVDASVMGDRFWRSGLQRLGTLPLDQLDEALESLELRGLILPCMRSSVPGERELAFRHELFAEVAYDTLTDPVRVAKHLQVARYLEEAGGDGVPPAVLARDWREAGDPDRAASCLVDAGDQANRGWGAGPRGRALRPGPRAPGGPGPPAVAAGEPQAGGGPAGVGAHRARRGPSPHGRTARNRQTGKSSGLTSPPISNISSTKCPPTAAACSYRRSSLGAW
jgi:hypothetical protein